MSTLAPSPHEATARDAAERRDGVLLTGATGFLGTELLARLLEHTDRNVYAVVRARSDAEAAQRLRETVGSALGSAEPFRGRVRALAGDLTKPGLGLKPAVAREVAGAVDEIVHGAAAVSFDLDLEQARAVNVEGTRTMLELALLCDRRGGLRRFTYISTAYVAGLHRGTFREDDLDVGQRFRNAYEQSKFEAEQCVRRYGDRLAITIVRPSIVVGDSRSGWTASFNTLYWPTRALARGAIPVLPARRRSPIDVVPVDYVADAVCALAALPAAGGNTYHLTSGRDATTVGELLALACDKLDVQPPPMIPPQLYLRVLAPLIGRLSPRRRTFVRATTTYVPYLAVRAEFDDRRARRTLAPRIRPARLPHYYGRIIDYALQTRWGTRPMTRAAAAARASLADVGSVPASSHPR